MFKNMLVPVDGSKASELALVEAIKLAKGCGGSLHLMHIVDEFLMAPGDPSYTSTSYYTNAIAALQESGRLILDRAVKTVRDAGLDPESTLVETFGRRVGELVIEKAKEWPADVIVMGTHGRRGLRRLVLGSDAEWVLRSSSVPVLLVRAADEAR